MAFFRRRNRADHTQPVSQRIEITLDGLMSARMRLGVAIQRYGEEHPESVDAMQEVAHYLLQDPRNHQEAAELLHYVAQLTYTNFGPDHPDTLTALYQAGDTLSAVGNVELAEDMLRRALSGQERALGRDHPETLATAQALGAALTELGRSAEAQALHEDVTERRTRALGGGHQETMISRNRTADALRAAGRFEEAAVLFRELVRAADDAYGAGSDEAAIARNNLAATEFQLGHAEEAAELFRAVLATVADKPGQESFAAVMRNNLATVLFELEEYHEADGLLRHSVAECERIHGPDHPDTIRSVANLARLLAVDGNRAEAARLTRRCLSHYEDRLPPSHPRIAELRAFLVELS